MKFVAKLLIILLLPAVSFAGSYYPGLLVVKFRTVDGKFPNLLAANSTKNNFGSLLGEISVKPACNPTLLDFIENRNYPHGNQDKIKSSLESVRKIFIIKYSAPADPVYVAAKLRHNRNIEYAEPLYQKKIVEYPNDTLAPIQTYLYQVEILNAWDVVNKFSQDTSIVIAGVVDTGVDYEHPDLMNNIWTNPGETGLDSLGRDKSTNSVDDDGNGFVDDWRGWDFVGANFKAGDPGDNDPYFGNPHGTMVSGIIAAQTNNITGVAGIGIRTKILPVKIGSDFQFDNNTYNSYEGLVYAAAMGCDVINLSWGDWNYSAADKEFTELALATGSAIIAAAGNDGKNLDFYPASFDSVMSVTGVDRIDNLASFGNYSSNVDISAPGENLETTFPLDDYSLFSGTSAATPVITGCAALVKKRFPEIHGIEIINKLKAAAAPNFEYNPSKSGLIGTGRVDAFKAVSDTTPVLVETRNKTVIDDNKDGVFVPGEKIKISFDLHNIYEDIDSVSVSYERSNLVGLINENPSLNVGKLSKNETKNINDMFEFTLPDEISFNYHAVIVFKISAKNNSYWYFAVEFLVNPSFLTINSNRISTTVTSQGNFAFNDFSSNVLGNGFSVDSSENLMFESGLIIGVNDSTVSSVVRGSKSYGNDKEFIILNPIKKSVPGAIAACETNCEFTDLNDSSKVGVKVLHHVYQFNEKFRSNFLISVYDIINESGKFYDSLFAGIYTDWDLGDGGKDNFAAWDSIFQFGYVARTIKGTKMGGMKLLSDIPVNYFAIDNNGTTADNPGVYDGFPNSEKWRLMSGGVKRKMSDTTDVSMLISAGPISLRNGDTIRVVFAIFAGDSLPELEEAAAHASAIPGSEISFNPPYASLPVDNSIATVFPNPTDGDITVELRSAGDDPLSLTLYDVSGRAVEQIFDNISLPRSIKRLKISLAKYSAGAYYLYLRHGNKRAVYPVEITR